MNSNLTNNPQDDRSFRTFKQIFKSPWIWVALIINFVSSIVSSISLLDSVDPTTGIFVLGIQLLVLTPFGLICLYVISKRTPLKKDAVMYFILFLLISIFILMSGYQIGGSAGKFIITKTYHQQYAKANIVYNDWTKNFAKQITIKSEDLGPETIPTGAQIFKTVQNKITSYYTLSGTNVSKLLSTESKTVSSPNQNAIAFFSDKKIEIFDPILSKKISIDYVPGVNDTISGGEFSNNLKQYQIEISYSDKSVVVDNPITNELGAFYKKYYCLIDLENGAKSCFGDDKIPNIEKQNLSISSDSFFDDECFTDIYYHQKDQLMNKFGYKYDYSYNIGSGEEKSITLNDSDHKYIYFSAINSTKDQTVMMRTLRTGCETELFMTPPNPGLIRSIYFQNNQKIIYTLNPKNSTVLEIYSLDLTTQQSSKIYEIKDTKIFELVN